ncbi:MAG: hypothetical protein ACOYOE_15020 [Chlorobium sp.]
MSDPATFAMQFHGRKELPIWAMAEQLACRSVFVCLKSCLSLMSGKRNCLIE